MQKVQYFMFNPQKSGQTGLKNQFFRLLTVRDVLE